MGVFWPGLAQDRRVRLWFCLCLRLVMKNSKELLDALGESPGITFFCLLESWGWQRTAMLISSTVSSRVHTAILYFWGNWSLWWMHFWHTQKLRNWLNFDCSICIHSFAILTITYLASSWTCTVSDPGMLHGVRLSQKENENVVQFCNLRTEKGAYC